MRGRDVSDIWEIERRGERKGEEGGDLNGRQKSYSSSCVTEWRKEKRRKDIRFPYQEYFRRRRIKKRRGEFLRRGRLSQWAFFIPSRCSFLFSGNVVAPKGFFFFLYFPVTPGKNLISSGVEKEPFPSPPEGKSKKGIFQCCRRFPFLFSSFSSNIPIA